MYQKLTERLQRRFSGATDDHITAALNDGIQALGYEVVEESTPIETPSENDQAETEEVAPSEYEPTDAEALAPSEPITITTTIPSEDVPLLLALVSYELATDLATTAANYFNYTDGNESVDKTNIMENYRALAITFKADYENELAKREAALKTPPTVFRVMKRIDRD